MSGKRYQVFVSSTYLDLMEERKVLQQVLPSLGCLPVGMEAHSTSPSAWQGLKKSIDECDYFVILLGSRYGSLMPTGVSYTHQEHVYASTRQKPILVLMHSAPESRPVELQEATVEGRLKFNDFRQYLSKGMVCRWSNVQDLEAALRQYIPQLIKARPMPGLVPASQASNPGLEKEVATLKARVAELEAEREQWLNSQIKPQALAQGKEPLEIQYQCNAYAAGNCEVIQVRSVLTWNDVFLSMAAVLSQPQTEELMHEKLAARIKEMALPDVQKVKAKAHAVTDILVNPLAFNTIKIQLRSLGLINRVKTSAEGKVWWQLTLAGEQLMTQLLVVPRKSPTGR